MPVPGPPVQPPRSRNVHTQGTNGLIACVTGFRIALQIKTTSQRASMPHNPQHRSRIKNAQGRVGDPCLPVSDVLSWRVTRRLPSGPVSSSGWAAARPARAMATVIRNMTERNNHRNKEEIGNESERFSGPGGGCMWKMPVRDGMDVGRSGPLRRSAGFAAFWWLSPERLWSDFS